MQVVFQITSSVAEAQKAMLGQLNNLLQYFQEKQTRIAVEVVVHGDAFNLLLTSGNPFADKVQALQERSVKWLICRNTMRGHQLDSQQLFSFVEIVPAAIAHLVERQAEGWSYIRC
ncbi:DsrE family protein [Chitinophaga sp. MM2321]|uniref:DsrE family protein n=1 Tax=Chitinophaga sp. MM2321 TaxID=3137178 RepID=UPI0032D586F2